jgi:hypothetical protein
MLQLETTVRSENQGLSERTVVLVSREPVSWFRSLAGLRASWISEPSAKQKAAHTAATTAIAILTASPSRPNRAVTPRIWLIFLVPAASQPRRGGREHAEGADTRCFGGGPDRQG